MAGLAGFLKPLNDVTMKADAMTQGRRSDFFNHLKAASDSLSALAWIAFTGKDCGKLVVGSSIFFIIFSGNDLIGSPHLARYEHANRSCGRKLADG